MRNATTAKLAKRNPGKVISLQRGAPPATPVMRRRGVRLRDMNDARRFLSRIVNEIYHGTLSEKVGRSLIYGISIFLDAVEASDIERRVVAVEEALAQHRGGNHATVNGEQIEGSRESGSNVAPQARALADDRPRT